MALLSHSIVLGIVNVYTLYGRKDTLAMLELSTIAYPLIVVFVPFSFCFYIHRHCILYKIFILVFVSFVYWGRALRIYISI